MADPAIRTVQWRRLAVESLAVVGSILLAFAIDAWWDGHQARGREVDLMRGMVSDFRASRPGLGERFELARRMARTNALLEARLSESRATAPLSVPDSLILGVIGGPTYEPATNTLDAALSSGEIELIRSDSLRAELANWRRTLVDTSEDEIEVRRITNEQVAPALARSVDLGPYYPQVLAWSAGDSTIGLPGRATIRPSAELAGLLAMRRFYVEFAADDLAALLASLDRSVELLERELGR